MARPMNISSVMKAIGESVGLCWAVGDGRYGVSSLGRYNGLKYLLAGKLPLFSCAVRNLNLTL